MMPIKRLALATAALGLAGALLPTEASAEKVLRVGLQVFPPTKANAFAGNGPPGVFLWNAIFDTLTDIDATGVVRPMIAERWQNVDPLTWRFTLRRNVSYWNGQTVTAKDVTEAIAWLLGDGRRLAVAQNVTSAKVATATAIDDFTVEIKTSAPNPILPTQLSIFPLTDHRHFAAVGVDRFTTEPMGSGAFKIDRFVGNGAELSPFAGHWRGRPKVDKLILVEIPEGAARDEAFLSGQVDINNAVAPDSFARVRAAGARIDAVPSPRVTGFSLISAGQVNDRGKTTPFADRRVRQAVNHAVDKESMVKNLLGGYGKPGSQAATPTVFGYNPAVQPYAFDTAKAKGLLTEAGLANGFPLKIQARVSNAADKLTFEQAAADLGRVGIKVELIPINFATWLKHFQEGNWESDAFDFGYFFAPDMDASAAMQYVSCNKTPPVSIYYCNEQEKALIAQAASEFDPDKRKKILQDLLQINRDNAPILTLIATEETMAVNARVQNFRNVNLKLNYHEMDVPDR